MARRIAVLRRGFPHRAAYDTAVSAALLRRVARGELTESLRLSIPGAIVAFGRRDAVEPGYADAVRAARRAGFAAVERLAGGRAAAFTPHTLAFSWTIPADDPRAGVHDRFAELAAIMAAAFSGLGVDARIGEVPGEYCPGAYSVNARGVSKLMGAGQRLVAGAAHIGGVVVVDEHTAVRDVLLAVNAALGIEWEPTTAGSIAAEVGAPVDGATVARSILAEFDRRFELVDGLLDEDTLALAERLERAHRSPDGTTRPEQAHTLDG